MSLFGCSSAFWGGFHAFWGSVIIMGDIYGSNFFFAHFENSNFGQFAIFLANLRYFWPWRSSEGPKGPDLVPTATGWSNWVGNIHIMFSGPLRDIYGTPGAPRRARFGPTPSVSWPNFGSKKNWSEYRQVRCPGRRNGTPCSYSPIMCHLEPSRWIKLPKT